MSAPKALCPDCMMPVAECLGHDDDPEPSPPGWAGRGYPA